MSAATNTRLRLVGESGPPRDPSPRAPGWLFPAIVVAAILAMLFTIGSQLSTGGRALRALPRERRAALLSSTVDELRQFCGAARPDALRDHCHELASFAAQFDECSGECEVLVRRELTPVPTR